MEIYDKKLFFASIFIGIFGIIDNFLAIKNSYNISLVNVFLLLLYIFILISGIYTSTSRQKVYENEYNKKLLQQIYEEEFKNLSFLAKYIFPITIFIGFLLTYLPFKDKELIFLLSSVLGLILQIYVNLKIRKKYKKTKY